MAHFAEFFGWVKNLFFFFCFSFLVPSVFVFSVLVFPFSGLFPSLSSCVSCLSWSKPRMSKEGFGPVEEGGPVSDVRASE